MSPRLIRCPRHTRYHLPRIPYHLERIINHHHNYHIAQASQATCGSLVDRGANGGLATITGMDSHVLQGLDVVQCAAFVETYHGIVNLTMNEYAHYGKGHTIHFSGQI